MSARHVRSSVDSMLGPEPGPFCAVQLECPSLNLKALCLVWKLKQKVKDKKIAC